MAGAPNGNNNAGEGRRWREAVRRALARSAGTIDRGLDRLADKLVARAADGAPWAIEHIAERIDGAAVQRIQVEQRVTIESADAITGKLEGALAARQTPTVQ